MRFFLRGNSPAAIAFEVLSCVAFVVESKAGLKRQSPVAELICIGLCLRLGFSVRGMGDRSTKRRSTIARGAMVTISSNQLPAELPTSLTATSTNSTSVMPVDKERWLR